MINLFYFVLFGFFHYGFSSDYRLSSLLEKKYSGGEGRSEHLSQSNMESRLYGSGRSGGNFGKRRLSKRLKRVPHLGFSKRRGRIAKKVHNIFLKTFQNKQKNLQGEDIFSVKLIEEFRKIYIDDDQGFMTFSSKIEESVSQLKDSNSKNIDEIIRLLIVEFLIDSIKKTNQKELTFDEKFGIIYHLDDDNLMRKEKSLVVIVSMQEINTIVLLMQEKFLVKVAESFCKISKIHDVKVAENGEIITENGLKKKVLVTRDNLINFVMRRKSIKIGDKDIDHKEFIDNENEAIFKSLLRDEMSKFIDENGLASSCLQLISHFSDFHNVLYEVICAIGLTTKQVEKDGDFYYFKCEGSQKIKIAHKDFIDKLKDDGLIKLMNDYFVILKEIDNENFVEDNFENEINKFFPNRLSKKEDNGGWILNYLTVLLGTIEYININKKNDSMQHSVKKKILLLLNKIFFEQTLKQKLYSFRDAFAKNDLYSKFFDVFSLQSFMKNKYLYKYNNMEEYLQGATVKNDPMYLLMYIGGFTLAVYKYIEAKDMDNILNEKNLINNYFSTYFNKNFKFNDLLQKAKKEKEDLIKQKNTEIADLSKEIVELILKKRNLEEIKDFDTILTNFITKLEDKKGYQDNAQFFVKQNEDKMFQFSSSIWNTSKNIFISMSKDFGMPIEGLVKINESDFDKSYNLVILTFIQYLKEELSLLKSNAEALAHEKKGASDSGQIESEEKEIKKEEVLSEKKEDKKIKSGLSGLFENLNSSTDVGNQKLLTYLFQLNWNTCFAIRIYQDIIKNSDYDKLKEIFDEDIKVKIDDLLKKIKELQFLYFQNIEILFLSPESGYFIDGAKIMLVTSGLAATYLGVGSWLSGGIMPLLENTLIGAVQGAGKLSESLISHPQTVAAGMAAYGVWRYRGAIVNQYKRASSRVGALAGSVLKKVKNWFS